MIHCHYILVIAVFFKILYVSVHNILVLRPNKKISVFQGNGSEILGRVHTHIFFSGKI